MYVKSILVTLCAASFLAGAHAAETAKTAAAAFPCQGFTKRADGSWWAGPSTVPFDFGTSKHMTLRDSGPITKGSMVNGNLDLYDVLEANCRTKH